MVSSQTVAALYIDPRGPYPRLWCGCFDRRAPGHSCAAQQVDCWDAERDARLYSGPHPVVAHPPCKHWGRLRHLAHVECRACGFDGPDRGAALVAGPPRCPVCGSIAGYVSDRYCAPRAVEQVRAFGGVLEHPAGSKLWEECGLPYPDAIARESEVLFCVRDEWGGYTIEVDQVEWGHVARKRTWLYLVGVPREALEAPPFPGREPTHYIGGGRATHSTRKGSPIPAGVKAACAQQRRRTPPLFAEYLVRLARSVQK